MVSGDVQFVTDRSGLVRQDVVFRRATVCRGSRASDTSSGYSPYSSVYSTNSDYSSTSDLSVPTTEFDVTGSTVIAADSDVEDGFVESSSSNPVSLACTLSLYDLPSSIRPARYRFHWLMFVRLFHHHHHHHHH